MWQALACSLVPAEPALCHGESFPKDFPISLLLIYFLPIFFLVSDIVAYTSLEITTTLLPQPFQCWNFPTMSAFVPSASSWQHFQTWVMGGGDCLKGQGVA